MGATSTHTPGPWTLHEGNMVALVIGKNLRIIVDHCEDFGDPLPDARLTAAAPELLEACRLAKIALRPSGHTEQERADTSIVIRAAIRKATEAVPSCVAAQDERDRRQ